MYSFLDYLVQQCLTPAKPLTPALDGKVHRFDIEGRPHGKKHGWYVGHDAGDYQLVNFGDWQTGAKGTWCSKQSDSMTATEKESYKTKLQELRKIAEAEALQLAKQAKTKAERMLNAAQDVHGNHAYLQAKGIIPYEARQLKDMLLIPVLIAGELSSLQVIHGDGKKTFLTGGNTKGGYCLLGNEAGDVALVCEGWATGCTLHQATGYPVYVAFNAGNLKAVAQAVRQQQLAAKIMLCADDDWRTEGNPGVTRAKEAAQAALGAVVAPVFPEGHPRQAKETDFNDLYRAHDIALVGAQIEQAITQFSGINFSENTLGTNLINLKNPKKEDFGELLPIPEGLRPVEAFDFDLLPFALREWVKDTANRMQCPPDFVAVGAMVALSSVIGRKAVIRPKQHDNWEVVPNLWGMVVGRPGVMKSPALAEMMRPLNELQRQANEDHKQAQKDLGVNSKLAALTQKDTESRAQKLIKAGDNDGARALLAQLQSEEDAQELKARRYIANDASVEALGEILADNPSGILVYRDELHGLLSGLDRQGQEGSRAFYLQSYDGNQSYTFDRILRGLNIHIPAVCLAMLGGIQPGKLRAYVSDALEGGAGDDGLLQRFGLMVWPDIPQHWQDVDQDPNKEAAEVARAVFMRLDALPVPNEEQPPITYRFAPDALELFKQWRYELETELRTGDNHPALESHVSKYRKLMPALALVIGMAEGEEEYISRESTIRACLWIQYLRSHAERVYAAGANRQYDTAKLLLDKIKAGKIRGDTFKAADVYLKGWAGLGSPSIVNNACALLCELGYLRKVVIEQGTLGGRPNESYAINPKLFPAGE